MRVSTDTVTGKVLIEIVDGGMSITEKLDYDHAYLVANAIIANADVLRKKREDSLKTTRGNED